LSFSFARSVKKEKKKAGVDLQKKIAGTVHYKGTREDGKKKRKRAGNY